MCTTPNFKKKQYDIVQVLHTSTLSGETTGNKIWVAIEKILYEIPDETLIVIDISRCISLEYTFCQYAFGPLFHALENKCFQGKYVIFQMNDYHQPGFFLGVMCHFIAKFPSEESREKFISANKYAKLINNIGNIDFVGKLEQNENTILDVVNRMGEITVEKVMVETGMPAETIVRNLYMLVQKYFILGPFDKTNSPPIYYSFKKYFYQE